MKQLIGFIVVFLAVFTMFPVTIYTEKIDPVTLDVLPEPEDVLYNRAPDPLPWIPPEMQTADYWISTMEKPDEVILTPQQIQRMNESYRRRISSPDPFKDVPAERKPNLIHWWPGFSLTVPDLSSMSARAVADTVKDRINAQIAYLCKQKYGNALAITYGENEINALEHEMALDCVGNAVTVRHGITVRTSRLRNNPSFFPMQIGLTQSRKTRWDLWNIGVVKIAKPVQVLHLSKSGEYMFVLCEVGYGWVRSENVAFASKQEIETFTNNPDFVVCTGDRVQFYTDESCTCASNWFGMGARLPLASKNNPRVVNVPVRKINGNLAVETAWLASDGNTHAGWLPYTRRNIIVTAFKLLGNTYDWSGAWFGRQHETTYRDIFACFGFDLPCHGTLFTFFNDNNTTVLHPDMGESVYYKKILENKPFVTIQSCGGHCQLFIGKHNGKPVVFDQHGYGYPDEDNVWFEVRRCNIGDLRLPRYFLKRDVTFLELR
ncbi:MAG: SH3 domain-containing protein [Candidatus Latescibacteria bacterium]|nr:SH3 domain-containing protein [Candidatus Latescibacterota bacterium]